MKIAKEAVFVAIVVFFGWLKWQQAKRSYERDPGDGGIRTLLGSAVKKTSPPAH